MTPPGFPKVGAWSKYMIGAVALPTSDSGGIGGLEAVSSDTTGFLGFGKKADHAGYQLPSRVTRGRMLLVGRETFPQPNARLLAIGELDAGGLKSAAHRLHC
jgi:hypothetical protein